MALFNKNKNIEVKSVSKGTVKTLASLKDGVFSEKMMGDGCVVAADKADKTIDIYAPITGKLVTVFPTKHAYGIRNKDGIEVLVHIGVDTVELKGKGFTSHVKQGNSVKQGDKIATVDLDYVRKNAPSADTVVLITSGQSPQDLHKGKIKNTDTLFTLKK